MTTIAENTNQKNVAATNNKNDSPILLIMAAGFGSRYGGNKQIDAITPEGDIIMDYSLYDAYRAGFRRAIFVIRHDFEEEFKAHMEPRAGKLMDLTYVFQEPADIPEEFTVPEGRTKAWGTAHAVLTARDEIDAPFAVINADDYYGRESFQLIYDFLTSSADAEHHCMVGFKVENTLSDNGSVSRGVCMTNDGYLTDIEEHIGIIEKDGEITGENTSGQIVSIAAGTPISMNLWGFGREFIDVMREMLPAALTEILKTNPIKGEFYLPSCVDAQIKSDNADFQVLRTDEKWYGVTYREDKEAVTAKFEEMKQTNYYPRHLW